MSLYHVNDSGYGDGALFRATGQKCGGFDLAILPIGAYEPASFMADSLKAAQRSEDSFVAPRVGQALRLLPR